MPSRLAVLEVALGSHVASLAAVHAKVVLTSVLLLGVREWLELARGRRIEIHGSRAMVRGPVHTLTRFLEGLGCLECLTTAVRAKLVHTAVVEALVQLDGEV